MGEVYTSVLSSNLWLNVTTSSNYLSSYPGLLTPACVARSTWRPSKTDHMHVGWACGGVANIFCTAVKRLSELKKHCQDFRMLSTQSFCGPCLGFEVHSPTCGFSGNVPLLHTSTQCLGTSMHVTSSTKPSPTLGLPMTNTGVRRPGYKNLFKRYYSNSDPWQTILEMNGITGDY